MSLREMRLIGRGSPFELEECTVEDIVCRHFRHGPKTLLELYKRAAASSQSALIVSGPRRLSGAELFAQVASVAQGLATSFGIRSGSRVAIVMENQPEWLIAFAAITSMGATAVAVHCESSTFEIVTALNDADCSLIIADADRKRVLSDFALGCPVVELPGSLEAPTPLSVAIHPDQPALIALTSGTTGRPKGVVLSHFGMMNGMMNMLLGGALAAVRGASGKPPLRNSPPVSLLLAPFSHIGGYSNFLLMSYVGGKIVTLAEWNAGAALDLIAQENVTSLVGITPVMMDAMLAAADDPVAFHSLRSVSFHGTALPTHLLSAIATKMPNVSVGAGYGMTETNGSICVAAESELLERPGTCGKPLPTVDLEIRPADHEILERAGEGEIWVRGPMLMLEYYNRPEATADTLQHGWLRTGDLGHLDADGYLHIADRARHIVHCDGVSISCAAVERVVMEHSLASEAVAFGVPNAQQGERLVVAVSPRPGQCCSITSILEHLETSGLTGSTRPRIVELSELPHTPSGKVDRRKLRRAMAVHTG